MSKKTSKKDPHAAREAAKYDRPIPSREFLVDYLNRRKAPATYPELLGELGLAEGELSLALHRRLKAMVRDGQLEKLKGGLYWPAGNRILIEGHVLIERGKTMKTWVLPTNNSGRIQLFAEDARVVYTGNRVIVSTCDIPDAKVREGKLVEIIEQQRVVVTGRFVKETGFCYVIPHGKEVVQNILIPQGQEQNALDGDIVVIELQRQTSGWSEPLGKVIEVLGSENRAGIEVEAAIYAYNLPHQWPKKVSQEIKGLTETIPAKAERGRLDVRDLPFVTIDGEDAKDFDDAVYCEERTAGSFKLYVAIADVSEYVLPNTELDREAITRGTSVYFPGKVVPMLPEILSNGLCSLKPEVDRLCMICIMSINSDGKMTRYEFQEGIMRSQARLTYTKVAALLENNDAKLKDAYAAVFPHLQTLHRLYLVLKKARELRGAIEFETIETRIIFNQLGKISRIEPVTRNTAHRLIEECMLCANVACAKFLKKHKLPGLYRNHEGPPADKLADLKTFLNGLGLPLGGDKAPTPMEYAKLLRSVQHRADANIIQTVLLRSLSQAVYSKDNLGHFGLAYPIYCHFTSPIRRYPDLLVHRQIKMVLRGLWTDKKKAELEAEEFQIELAKLADHTSVTERRADDASRDVVRWLKCQYIQQHIGEEYQGVISGVTRFGFFVELKNLYIDGLIHVTSLTNDYYYFDAARHALVGEKSGVSYQLGDELTVKVAKVNVDERKIDFELSGIDQQKINKKRIPKKAFKPKTKSKKRKKKSL